MQSSVYARRVYAPRRGAMPKRVSRKRFATKRAASIDVNCPDDEWRKRRLIEHDLSRKHPIPSPSATKEEKLGRERGRSVASWINYSGRNVQVEISKNWSNNDQSIWMKRSSLEEMNIFEYCLFLHTKISPIKYDFNSSVLIRIVRNLRKMGWILIITFYLKILDNRRE